ncbi:MAG: ABC transporter permease [Promethearchaeota archaeon]
MATFTARKYLKMVKAEFDPLSLFLLFSVLVFFILFLVIPVVTILLTAFIIDGQFSFKFFVDVFKNPVYFELDIGSFIFISSFGLVIFFASRLAGTIKNKGFDFVSLLIPSCYTIVTIIIILLFSDALTSVPQCVFGIILALLFLGIGIIVNKSIKHDLDHFFLNTALKPTLALIVGIPVVTFLFVILLAASSQLLQIYDSFDLELITFISMIGAIIVGIISSFLYSRQFSRYLLSSSFLKPFFWLSFTCIILMTPFLFSNYDFIVEGWRINFFNKVPDPQYGYILIFAGIEASVLVNTIFVAIATTFISAILGVFFAFVIARYEFFGKSVIRAVLLFPLVVPPFVGAIGIKRMLAHPQGYSFFNRLFYDAIPILQFPIILKGLTAVILVQSVHFYTLIYLNSLSAFQNIDPTLEESGENLGASGSKLFRSITFPLALPGIAAGSILTFILSVEDLGTPLIFSGDVEIQNLLTTKVFTLWQDQLGTLQGDGLALAVILFVIAMTGFAFIRKYVGIREYAMVSKGGVFNPRSRKISIIPTLLIIISVVLLMSFALLPHIGSFFLSVSDNFTWDVTNPKHLFPTSISFKLLSPDIGDLIRVISIPTLWILGWLILYFLYRLSKNYVKLPDPNVNPKTAYSFLIIAFLLPIVISIILSEISRIFIPSLEPIIDELNLGIGTLITEIVGQIGEITNLEFLTYIKEVGGFSNIISRTTMYAFIAMILIILLGVAAAYILARKEFPGKFAFDTLVTSPIAIPGIIVGFGLFIYYIPTLVGLLGREYQVEEIMPGFYLVHFLLIASFTVRRFPFTVRAAYAGLQQTHVTFEEASTNLGASNLHTILRITIPLIAVSVIAGAMISFVYALGEVSTSLILLNSEAQATIPWMINEKNSDPLPHEGILGVNEAAALGVLLILLQVIIISIANSILKRRGSALTGI